MHLSISWMIHFLAPFSICTFQDSWIFLMPYLTFGRQYTRYEIVGTYSVDQEGEGLVGNNISRTDEGGLILCFLLVHFYINISSYYISHSFLKFQAVHISFGLVLPFQAIVGFFPIFTTLKTFDS
jgi:hypothetical protein